MTSHARRLIPLLFRPLLAVAALALPLPAEAAPPTAHRHVEVDGVRIFYREAGPKDAPHVLLLHGFPTSSHMFRNLIPALADRFHVVAPDYPGFGHSDMPAPDAFDYTFDHLADVIDAFTERVGLDAMRSTSRTTARRSASGWPSGTPSASARSSSRTATPTTRASESSGSRSRRTGRSRARRTARRWRSGSSPRRPSGSTPTARDVPSASAPTPGWSTRRCSTARATRRSSCSCSTATARTRRSTRSGRRTSARTSRRR